MKLLITIVGMCLGLGVFAQMQWTPLERITTNHLRGLCVVNDSVVWAGGVGGTWLKTTNGRDWTSDTISGAAKLDFRDIHAIDQNIAWVISAGDIGNIYHTLDGGKTWTLQYSNTSKGIFFDGFAFWDEKSGIAYSDPINGKLFVVKTEDGGKNWNQLDPNQLPPVLEREAGFAASGTGIVTQGDSLVWVATGGGKNARVFKSVNRGESWTVHNTPLISGEGMGIFSMAFMNELEGVVVGGSYMDSTNTARNCAFTTDGGFTWQLVDTRQPNGYRSCVTVIDDSLLITTGRTGSEYSTDKGRSWISFGGDGYYSCGCGDTVCWAVGRNGKMAKLILK